MTNDGEKPKCVVTGTDGNVFMVLCRVRVCMKKNGLGDQVEEMTKKVTSSKSYEDALSIMNEYVDLL